MYKLNSLTKNNLRTFKDLNNLRTSFNAINKDFFQKYNKESSLYRFLEKKKIKLLKKDQLYVGYIWSDHVRRSIYRIHSMVVVNNGSDILNQYTQLLQSIKSYSKIYYECEDTAFNNNVLKKLGFIKQKGLFEMQLNLDKFTNYPIPYNISFHRVFRGKDEALRCHIQNSIFESDDRVPLDVVDIYYDELQDYYFRNGAIFIKKDNEYIGYGQIILKHNTPYIVNFGILNKWQNNGYGKFLLSYLLNILKKYNYKTVYINVDFNNYCAINLYKSFGFKTNKEVSTWMLNKN